MSWISFLFVAIGFSAFFVAFVRPTSRDAIFFLALYGVHLGAAVAYWQYVLENGGDAVYYYENPFNVQTPLGQTGTLFVVGLVQTIKSFIGGTLFDHFMIFQLFGLFALALSVRTVVELAASSGTRIPGWFYFLFLAPGLHFWTVAIGKDGPVSLGVALSVWAMVSLPRRWIAFVAGVGLMFFFRPHIAALALAAVPLALVLDQRTSILTKMMLGLVSAGMFAVAMPTVLESLNIQVFDADNIEQFIASRQDYGMRSENSAELMSLPFPLKVASLLFRPFFFDASGAMGLMASLENAVLVGLFALLIWNFRGVSRLARQWPVVRYCLVYATVLIIALSLVNYNIGLGLRQKMMVMPSMLILFFAAVTASRRLGLHNVRVRRSAYP